MAKCEICGAPVNLAPDGDPRYDARRLFEDSQFQALKTEVEELRQEAEALRENELRWNQEKIELLTEIKRLSEEMVGG